MTPTEPYPFFQRSHFAPLADAHRGRYASADPFPHSIIDNFLPSAIAERVHDAFPDPTLPSFEQPDNAHQVGKLGRTQMNDFRGVPDVLRHVLRT